MTDDLKNPNPAKFITLKNARIVEVHLEDDNPHHWKAPYFVVETAGGELHRIRGNYYGENKEEFKRWVYGHKNKGDSVDVVIFPYKWIAGDKSGVVYFFQSGKALGE